MNDVGTGPTIYHVTAALSSFAEDDTDDQCASLMWSTLFHVRAQQHRKELHGR